LTWVAVSAVGVRGYVGIGTSSKARRTAMAGKFELYKDTQGKFRFRLKAGNGQIIAVGEAYESKSAALNGIDSVRRNAADAELVDEVGS
jgi:uncharacterized protein YegP (UPF0339 family)